MIVTAFHGSLCLLDTLATVFHTHSAVKSLQVTPETVTGALALSFPSSPCVDLAVSIPSTSCLDPSSASPAIYLFLETLTQRRATRLSESCTFRLIQYHYWR